ncbi:MAG: MmgE/PrpD family protein [bacterium]|nr:MmgE/PrpD family protein [bacterium]
MSLTRNLVERVFELQFDDLAQEDLSATRLLLLDHLGVAANGSTTDSGACIQRFALASGEGSSSIVGTSLSATPLYAAMANAVAAHSIEYDDVHSAASSHPGVVIFPAAFAAAVRAGRASLAEYDGSLFSDPEVLRIMDATHCVVDTELDRIYPQQWSGWAEVKTTDGRTFRESIDDPKGDPNNPLSPRELRSKFDELTTHVYSAGRRHEIADVVEGLGTASNLEELIAILPTDLG